MHKLMTCICAQQKYVLQCLAATRVLRFRVAMVAYLQPAVHAYNLNYRNVGVVSKGAMRRTVTRHNSCNLDLGQCG